jgi:hypothetical protein
MDPISLLLLGGQVLGNAFGLSKSAQANKRYDSYLDNMTGRINGWYNKEYNTNYLDTDEAKSVLRQLMEQSKEISDDMDSSAAITGASAEKQVATKEKLNKNYAGAMSQLAGQGTRRKERIQSDYLNRMSAIDQLKLQNLMQKSQNWNQFGQNVSGAAQGAMLMQGEGAYDNWLAKLMSKNKGNSYSSFFRDNEIL